MITDFGQRSFVTWTTGLVERVQKAEKEKRTMIRYRHRDGDIRNIIGGDLFVTKDKNGKDVFAGDEIKALTSWRGSCREPQAITGKVGWRDETLSWVLYHTLNTPECVDLWRMLDIELIEDKDNE